MTVLATVSVIIVVAAALLGMLRLALGPDDATRAVVGDLLFFCAIAVFLITGTLRSTSVLFDVALLATLCGVLATAALARMLTRGDR